MLLCDSFAAFAEFRRNFIRECTKDGPAATQCHGL
jgi:hypothetical protein